MPLPTFCLCHSIYLECPFPSDGLLSNSTLPWAQILPRLWSLTLSISSEVPLFLLNSNSNNCLNKSFDNHPSLCEISLILFFKIMLLILFFKIMWILSPLLNYTLFKGRVSILEFSTASRMSTMEGSRVSLNLRGWAVVACYEEDRKKRWVKEALGVHWVIFFLSIANKTDSCRGKVNLYRRHR